MYVFVPFPSDVPLLPDSLSKCRDKSPLDRAKLLENTELLGAIHASAAFEGQSSVPLTEADVDQAYTCFVVAPEQELLQVARNKESLNWMELVRGLCTDVARIVKSRTATALNVSCISGKPHR